jgi:hypothetical protein
VVRGGAKFIEQFGEDPSQAPTGKEIAAGLGAGVEPVADLPLIGEVSPAGIAGLGIDILADPTNIIPVAAPAKLLKEGAKATGKAALKGSAAAAEFAGRGVGLGPAIDVAKQTGTGAKAALSKLFKPVVAEDFPELAAIARQNGIDPAILPESIEFGQGSIISRATRVQREGVLGEELLDQFIGKLQKVQEATDAKISQIGGGTVLSPAEAGNLIRQDYDRAVGAFFDNVDTSYNSIIKDFPGLKLSDAAMAKLESKLRGIEQFAKGRVARGVTQLQRAQGQGLLNSVEAIRNTNGSVKQTVEALRDIGEAAFKSENTLAAIPADVAKMRNIYGDITDALMDTVRTEVQNGEAVAGALQINNKLMSEFFGQKSLIDKAVGSKTLAPEGVFRQLIQNGDTKKIDALKKILSPEAMQTLKASMLDGMIKRTEDGFSYRALTNAMRTKQNQLTALLSPDELREFSDLVRLGDRFGPATMNTSGTAINQLFRDIFGSINQSITNEAFIEGLKRKARQRAAGFELAGRKAAAAQARGLQIPTRRGPFETVGLKVPQVISVQQRNQGLQE